MLFSLCRRKLTENVVVHFLLPKACVLAHQGPWSQERPKEGTTEDMDTWTPLCLSSQGGLLDSSSTWLTSCFLCGRELSHHRWKSPFLSRQLDPGPVLSVTPGTFYDISFSLVQPRQQAPRHGSLETAMRWHFSSFGHGAGAKPQRHIPFLGWEIAKLLGHEFLHSAFTCGFVPPRNWCRSLVSYDFSSEHGSRYLNCTASTWELRQENWEFQASLGAKAKLCLKKLSKTFTQMNLIFWLWIYTNEFDFSTVPCGNLYSYLVMAFLK